MFDGFVPLATFLFGGLVTLILLRLVAKQNPTVALSLLGTKPKPSEVKEPVSSPKVDIPVVQVDSFVVPNEPTQPNNLGSAASSEEADGDQGELKKPKTTEKSPALSPAPSRRDVKDSTEQSKGSPSPAPTNRRKEDSALSSKDKRTSSKVQAKHLELENSKKEIKKELEKSAETSQKGSKRSQKTLSPLPPPSEKKKTPQMTGWLMLRRRVGKTAWKKRFFVLQGWWLTLYKDEKMRVDQTYGFIKVLDCEITSVNEKGKDKIVIMHPDGKRIYHRHGPLGQIAPPAARRHAMQFKLKHTCKLRVPRSVSSEEVEKWLKSLKLSADLAAASGSQRSDEDSSQSDDELYESWDESTSFDKSLKELPVVEPGSKKETRMSLSREYQLPEKPGDLEKIEDEALNTADQIEATTDTENREGIMKILTNAVGLDITSIALPVSLNEPTSFLQRMVEPMQYVSLLAKADQLPDPSHRAAYVAAFSAAIYSTINRVGKPFNPLLGETFDYIDGDVKMVCEQVSHHPPVAACHAESPAFEFWQEQGLKTKFGGNSLACESTGEVHLILKSSGDHYRWTGIQTTVHNVILGRMWIEHHGDLEIKNLTNGFSAKLDFKKSGWFGKGKSLLEGWIVNGDGKTTMTLEGKWSEAISVQAHSAPALKEKNPVWTANIKEPDNKWKLSEFAQKLNQYDDSMRAVLPVTDSRLRPDRAALEREDNKVAAATKKKLETEQRQRKQKNGGAESQPLWFQRDPTGTYWEFGRKYWEERETGWKTKTPFSFV